MSILNNNESSNMYYVTNLNEKIIINGKEHDNLNSTILLVDLTINISEIKKILEKETIHTIISFDYESHILLQKNKIPHILSDSFVTRNDLVNIQNKCYDYVKWFENDELKRLIDYEGINLGASIQIELNYFLVPFVKKFVEVLKIFKQHNSASFFTSPVLYQFIRLHTNSVSKLNSLQNIPVFYYDTLKIPLKFGKYDLTFRISKRQFNTLARVFDRFISTLLRPQQPDNEKKTTLIVEFDPIRYKNLFEELPKVAHNFMIYNRRKPAVWNFQSLSVVRSSGCRTVTTNSILDDVVKQRISKNLVEVQTNIQLLWKFDDFFQSFFSIEGFSFWTVLESAFKDLFTKRALELIPEIEMAKKIFQKYKIDSILILSEIGSTEQIMVKIAKLCGVKVVLLQHGLFYDSESDGAYKMNKFQGVYPSDADKYVIWGSVEEKHQIKRGTPNEMLAVLGNPLYDDVSNNNEEHDKQDYILLATSGPVKENALDLTIETVEKNQKTIQKICQIVSGMNKKLIIKIHPSPDEFDPTALAKQIDPNIVIKKTGNIDSLIKNCEVFVMIDASTVILDAHLLKKPVISVLVKDSDYGIPSVLSQSCLLTDMNGFEQTLSKLLSDRQFKKAIIEKGTSYAEIYLTNLKTASMKLVRLLTEIS